jgi:iron complex outermembrane receptor protein
VSLSLIATPVFGADDLTDLRLEDLLKVPVMGASKYEQTQTEVAAAVSILTRRDIQTFGWRTLDEALASLPGLYTTYDRQYAYLGARGFGLPGDYTTRVLITVNGNRFNDPTYDGGPVDRRLPLDLGMVERIEFIPGPGGAVYGQNAMLGVVNIVTRSGADLGGVEVAFAPQYPQGQYEARASWGAKLDSGLDVLVSVSGLDASGDDLAFDYGAAGVSGTAVGLDADRDREFFARVAGGAWTFDLAHGDRRKDDPTAAFLSDPLVPGQYQGDEFTVAQVEYHDALGAGGLVLSGRAFLGRHRYSSLLSYGTTFAFPAYGDWHGAELGLLVTSVENHKIMVGVEAQNTTRRDQAVLDLADPANNLLMAGSGHRFGVFVQDEWRLAESLSATLGLRVDRTESTGSEASPRAGLIWQRTPATTFKILLGRAHRAPNAYERDYDDGFAQVSNLMLDIESIDTFEIVADHRVNEDLSIRGSVYRWSLEDLITLGVDPVSGLPQYQSGPRTAARGVELSTNKTWDSGVRLRGSVSWQTLRAENDVPALNSPETLLRLNVSGPLPIEGLRIGYEFRYDGSRMSLNGTQLGASALSNVLLSAQRWGKGLELALGFYNLFDEHYEHPGSDTNWQNSFVQDGRSIVAKIDYAF